MYTGEFSHHGDLCTFEVLAGRFRLQSPAVETLGHIVHDLDMKDTKYGLPEAAAVGRMVEALRAWHADDATLLEHGIGMFNALAHSFESGDGAVRRPQATYWGTGPADKLSTAFRAALDQLGPPKTTTAKH